MAGAAPARRPGPVGRLISRQAARPSGLLGRFIGRVMVKDSSATDAVALELLASARGERILEVGFGQGRTVSRLLEMGAGVDGAVTAPTVYFWPEPDATMREIRRSLRPGGRFVIAFRAGDEDPPARLDPAVYDFSTTEAVVELLETAGFGTVELVDRPEVDAAYRWVVATAPG